MADLAIVDGVIEGPSGEPLMSEAGDVDRVIEACYSNRIRLVLLYAENLPDRFFDLSSCQAGAILQKLRNYRMRLAVVAPGVQLSDRFRDLMTEERKDRWFGVFDTREDARAWRLGN